MTPQSLLPQTGLIAPPIPPSGVPPTPASPVTLAPFPTAFPGYGQDEDLGANWRIKFADADGIPLNMLSFEQIDFGAIAYKEIFQNVKTILATPLFSAALERLLGVDQSIVDKPIDQAALATVAILDALYFWEPRAQAVNIIFAADVLAGHLMCDLQLNINNVIYGTEQPYTQNNAFGIPQIQQTVMETNLIPGPPGKQGPIGQRGSLWFTGAADPTPTNPAPISLLPQDMYLNTTSGDIFQFQAASSTSAAGWQPLGRRQP
jgi:hypothetical protein